eukprot:g32463.t1
MKCLSETQVLAMMARYLRLIAAKQSFELQATEVIELVEHELALQQDTEGISACIGLGCGAIQQQKSRARGSSAKRDRLEEQMEGLQEEYRSTELEELAAYKQRHSMLEEFQEIRTQTLRLCEELGSANQLAEMALEELHLFRSLFVLEVREIGPRSH